MHKYWREVFSYKHRGFILLKGDGVKYHPYKLITGDVRVFETLSESSDFAGRLNKNGVNIGETLLQCLKRNSKIEV